MKQNISNLKENTQIDPRSSQQSFHLLKSKPLITFTPSQVNKPQNLIQSLNGLSKYFKKQDDFKMINYFAPNTIQRSSASLSPRQIISINLSDNSPVMMKQLLRSQNYLKENLNPKDGRNITEFKSDKKLNKVNDTSSMDKFGIIQKSRIASVQYNEDWKLKYEELQESLCQRIQQLENELENMEKNRKIDRMHSDELTNQYIEQLQSIIAEKEQVIHQMDQKHQELEQIIQKQQEEFQKYKQDQFCDNLEIKRLYLIDKQFHILKQQLPVLASALRKIEQILDTSQLQLNDLSMSSISLFEIINDINEMNQGIQYSIENQNLVYEQLNCLVENRSLKFSNILYKNKLQ
ncbi:unnamed protein product (macronuclear) [Paramecium tetraurelia]|uniref:Uncharacterized protein n=1 Tax=Paramecium tetraurelia TaxID=5888 RepID=A0CIF6_PARTE|nr:uncharacterized protein GSPATT00007708001 [Paramecium tetraurelia]CAK70573.1 unnamed protein product [Paramecium tetraurelia]|eukprot:XP_001437970.1 hypothetical protein (macronuclear) [Paramecium tetraurelia strain d4-2]